jgi:hypothetical protein
VIWEWLSVSIQISLLIKKTDQAVRDGVICVLGSDDKAYGPGRWFAALFKAGATGQAMRLSPELQQGDGLAAIGAIAIGASLVAFECADHLIAIAQQK